MLAGLKLRIALDMDSDKHEKYKIDIISAIYILTVVQVYYFGMDATVICIYAQCTSVK